MRKLVLLFILALMIAVPATAQRIDASMLRLAAKFFGAADPEEREIRELINGLQGIYVRSYEFSKPGEYDKTLPDRLRAQLGPSWKPLVTVRSKTKENVNIMADLRGEQIVGLVIIAAEPRELTVVNIVGNIDIDRLSRLEGEFGIPKMTKEDEDE
jgi:hypothetical protein